MKRASDLFLLLIIILFINIPNALSAPLISSVNGSLISGESITISGANFGTNGAIGASDLQWLGDNIEAGSDGAVFSYPDWTQRATTESDTEAVARYDDDGPVHTGSKALLIDYKGGRYKGWIRYNHSGSPMSPVYITFWVYPELYEGSWGQWKHMRVQRGAVESDTNLAPGFVMTYGQWSHPGGAFAQMPTYPNADWWSKPYPSLGDGSGPRTGPCGDNCDYDHIKGGPTPGSVGYRDNWYRVEVYIDEGDQNACNGTFQYWIHDPGTAITKASQVDYEGNLNIRETSDHLHYVFLGHYAGDGTGSLRTWWDDVFVQVGGRQRIEIGDNSNWSSCAHREIQIPSEWSDNSITITANQGSFTDGENVYLFVVDAAGDVNSQGYPITIGGGGGGGDSSAPYTSGHSPAKDAVGFYRNSNIIVHLQDSGDGVDQSSIVMTVNGQTVSPNITGTSSDYTLTYDPPYPLEGDVVVTLNAQDLANPPNVMSQETYTFTVNRLRFVE